MRQGGQSCGKVEFGVEVYEPGVETMGSHPWLTEPPLQPPPSPPQAGSPRVPVKLHIELLSGAPSSR